MAPLYVHVWAIMCICTRGLKYNLFCALNKIIPGDAQGDLEYELLKLAATHNQHCANASYDYNEKNHGSGALLAERQFI